MPAPKLSDLTREYTQLFDSCVIRPEKLPEIESLVKQINSSSSRERYESVSQETAVPWFVIGVLHAMECGLSFKQHLHNGDPLSARTKQVPAGRPKEGSPPFAWEMSAEDALDYDGFQKWSDWSLPGTLFKMEGYNGWGTRLRKQIPTPYLWSYSNHYTRGKYVADGVWSDTAVSKQPGAAVILRRMVELGLCSFTDQEPPAPDAEPLIEYSTKEPADAETLAQVKGLQTHLNLHPGIFVQVDGVPGKRTSDAFRAVYGHYLCGDPRANG